MFPLAGTLPISWGEEQAYPGLGTLILRNLCLDGPLAPAWGSNGSFASLFWLDLQVDANSLSECTNKANLSGASEEHSLA